MQRSLWQLAQPSPRGEGNSRVAVAFFGDGATEEGQFHESLNFAALSKLPVLFVCENNWHSSHLRLEDRRPADNILDLARAHGLAAERVDGNDVAAMQESAEQAVARARRGDGSTFIEARTYRWRGHVGPSWDIDVGIRPPDELNAWVQHDPIAIVERFLGEAHEAAIRSNRDTVRAEVDEAWRVAEVAPYPEVTSATDFVFTRSL